jgi:hypothetical protein
MQMRRNAADGLITRPSKKGDKKEPPARLLKAMASGHPGQAERNPEFRISGSSGFWLLPWTPIRISPEGRNK